MMTSRGMAVLVSPCRSLPCSSGLVRPCVSAVAHRSRTVSAASSGLQRRRSVSVNFFKFGSQTGTEAGIYGSQKRDDYSQYDLDDYFNYMGILAEEGNYDSLNELVKANLHPVDAILLLACGQNDVPKLQEILRAGADISVRNAAGQGPMDLATKAEAVQLLKDHAAGKPQAPSTA